MPRFRKKPVVIEATHWRGKLNDLTEWPDWFRDAAEAGKLVTVEGRAAGNRLLISTLEGRMAADPGDWIIRGVKGELYSCKPDIFEATYEPVEDEVPV